MNIRVPDLRAKALREFVANPQYAGTDAVRRAQTELSRAGRRRPLSNSRATARARVSRS